MYDVMWEYLIEVLVKTKLVPHVQLKFDKLILTGCYIWSPSAINQSDMIMDVYFNHIIKKKADIIKMSTV